MTHTCAQLPCPSLNIRVFAIAQMQASLDGDRASSSKVSCESEEDRVGKSESIDGAKSKKCFREDTGQTTDGRTAA